MFKLFKKNFLLILIFLFFLIIYSIPKAENKIKESEDFIKNPHKKIKSDALRIGINKLKNPLNPLFDGENDISLITKLLHTSLFTRDKNNEIELKAAKEYWYENGGKTIAVVLKKGLKFQNGDEITINNIYNTYKVLANPSYSGGYAPYAEKIEGYYEYKSGINPKFEGIEILGNHFIKFHFQRPDFSNIKNLIFPILDINENQFEYGNVNKIKDLKFTNTSGYYQVTDYSDSKVTLSLKKTEEDSKIKLKKIEISLLDFFSAINQYERGDLDILYQIQNRRFLDNNISRLSDYSKSLKHQSNIYHFLGFNKNNLFKDKKYRKKIKEIIDFKKIIDTNIGEGVYSYPTIPVYSNSWFNNWHREDNRSEISSKKFNNITNKDEKNMTLNLIVQEDNKLFNSIEKDFIKTFNENGIQLKVKKLSSDKMYRALIEEKGYDLYISQHFMREIPEDFNVDIEEKGTSSELSKEINNRFLYLLEKVKENVNSPEIQDLSKLWTNKFNEETPYIVMANENITTIINKKIKNLNMNEFVGLDHINNLKEIDY